MNGKIYSITNLLDGKRYFGQTIRQSNLRWNQHKCAVRKNKNSYLYNAMRKYGIENFEFKVIIENISNYNELNRLEMVWIDTCNTTDSNEGYNICIGGNNGPKKKGCIAWNKGLWSQKRIDYEKRKSEGFPDWRIPWNKNKKNCHSEERKEIIRQQQLERMTDPEYKANCVKYLKKDANWTSKNNPNNNRNNKCEFCGKISTKSCLTNWHGDICLMNPNCNIEKRKMSHKKNKNIISNDNNILGVV